MVWWFSYSSFVGNEPKIGIFYNRGKQFAVDLEKDLSLNVLKQDGILLNLVKGILDHDMQTVFEDSELASSKEVSLQIIYRLWFIAYAESRNLLPVSDAKYKPISLLNLRSELDMYELDDDSSCWKYLLKLFEGIRQGSQTNNLPQYNGNLFEYKNEIDRNMLKNKWIIPALRDLLEQEGNAVDYRSLSVRHLGNILENVMEYSVKQANENMMLLVKNKKIQQVKTAKESNYSYKKHDLYLASKGGIVARKSTASYYTPDEIVKFLVEQALKPIIKERTLKIAEDMKLYENNPNEKNKKICIDTLLDIRILDPAMGSGHFLVEALNRLTSWITEMLVKHQKHPLFEDIKNEMKEIQDEQEKNKITIDKNLLTYDVLLKRKVMKRCIFGVDLTPMAVEIAKLALWLDSFAIGAPLTYMDHHIKNGDSTIGMFLSNLKGSKTASIEDYMPSEKCNELLTKVLTSPDNTISQVYESERNHREYDKSIDGNKWMLNALTASKIDPSIIPKQVKKNKTELSYIYRFGKYDKHEDADFKKSRKKVFDLVDRRKFFHWDLEMRDAFTDSRPGFDVIVGNPPWDKVIPYDDDFFTLYYPPFSSFSSKPKKNEIKELILNNRDIKFKYDNYLQQFKEKNSFYASYYTKQGVGHQELSKLIFERSLNLLSKNGILSMVIPVQFLSSIGTAGIRKEILNRDIFQMFVFENQKEIFTNVVKTMRFILLTIKNDEGKDKFPVGFYLHDLSSLYDKTKEKDKFGEYSKEQINKMFPECLLVPEGISKNDPLLKMYGHPKLDNGLGNGLMMSFSSGFNRTNDADLFRDDGNGWSIHEGKTIHQYNHNWLQPKFTALQRSGLNREKKPKYKKKHIEFHNSYRLAFRDISNPTHIRSIFATIIPPNTFHTNSLFSVIIKRDENILLNSEYIENILYLCGVMNSLSFDFVSRKFIQLHTATIIKKIPIPLTQKTKISNLAGKLTVGHSDFEGLSELIHIPNKPLTVSGRIDIMAELDVLVAKSYGLSKDEYVIIANSFDKFKENPELRDMTEITWDNKNLKEFYGEMRKKALEVF